MGYIYLIHEREFLTQNLSIYKIGKTEQENLKRFNGYAKGYKIILYIKVFNCNLIEKNLIKLLEEKFYKKKEYGNEYFEGDEYDICKYILYYIYLNNNKIDKRLDNDIDNKIDKRLDDELYKNIVNDYIIFITNIYEQIKYFNEKIEKEYDDDEIQRFKKKCTIYYDKRITKCKINNGYIYNDIYKHFVKWFKNTEYYLVKKNKIPTKTIILNYFIKKFGDYYLCNNTKQIVFTNLNFI